jgi:hypothetical protein
VVLLTYSVLNIELRYLTESSNQGELHHASSLGVIYLIAAYHILMLIASILEMSDFAIGVSHVLQPEQFSSVHAVVDFIAKLVISIMLFLAGSNRSFAAPHCNIWGFS